MRKNWLVKLERQTIDQKKIIREADITMVDNKRKSTKNEKMSMKENERLLIEKFKMIKPVEKSYEEQAKRRWKTVAKPLFSLGKLEDAVIRMAGIRRKADFEIKKKGLLIFCADNGVVSEGVTQTGQEVTAIVADNFTKCATSVCIMAETAGVDLFPIDIGMVTDVPSVTDPKDKVMYGTKNMAMESAMSREQAAQAVLIGIRKVKELAEQGYDLIATGEMGIGNTTTSSAVVSVLLDESVENVTGRGAGLSSEGLNRKIQAIQTAIEKNQPDKEDILDVLSKVGGLDIAGMTGAFLGGAIYHIPVLIDGFISSAAALCAVRMVPETADYILASHCSGEPAGRMVLEELKLPYLIDAKMSLGEGSGAVAAIPLLEMGVNVYRKMSTFEEIKVEQYEELK